MNEIPSLRHPVAAAADQSDDRQPPEAAPSRQRRLSRIKERFIEALLFLAALSSVAITLGIVFILVYESSTFFGDGDVRFVIGGLDLVPGTYKLDVAAHRKDGYQYNYT